MSATRSTLTPGLNRDGTRQLASALLHNSPTQVGGMVTSVILVGQAFAQFEQAMAPYAALVFSCLLAIYQVRLIQKATLQESLITIPIAAVILFALALGGNNSIAMKSANTGSDGEFELVKQQLKLRTQELENIRQLNHELRQNLGLPLNTSRLEGSIVTDQTQHAWHVLDLLISSASAQPTDSDTEKRLRLEQSLRAYRTKQQKLEREQKKLEEKEDRLTKEESAKESRILWRKW